MSALSNAVSVLRWLGRNGPEAGVTQVAAALGLPKSTASRVLKDMAAHGLLERDPATARYRVGMLLLEVGRGMAADVAALCGREGLRVERIVPDLQGIPRVVVAVRPSARPAAVPS